jgi:hypothetical protein
MVKDHYPEMGFFKKNGYWMLDALTFEPKKTFVNAKQ